MAIGHCRVTTITRAKGHTAAAALAYRFGTAVRCPRTGERPDFAARARRGEIAGTGIEAARPTPIAESAQTFTAAIETAERRRDSRLARDVQVALPCELDEPARLELARAFAAAIADRYVTVTAWAVHRPHEGDERNHHAHVLMATRELDESGQLAGKLRQLDNPRTAGDEVAAIRNLWGDLADQALERAGLEARVDVGRRLDTAPAPSPPVGVVGRERRGARGRAAQRHMRDVLTTPGDAVDPARLALDAARVAAESTKVAARTLVHQERAHLATVAAAAVAGATVTGPPHYERRARSRRARARDQVPERRRRPRPRRRDDPTEAHATAPAALEAPSPTPEPERPTRRRRRRIRPAPTLPAPSPAPAPIAPTPAAPNLEHLEQLVTATAAQRSALADLEDLAADLRDTKTDTAREETAMPPRIEAHADTHGRRPDRAPLRDTAEAERERADHARRAGEERARWMLDAQGEAIGERWLIRHAGYVIDPDDYHDIDESPDIERALEPHVGPFHVGPLGGHADEAEPERRHHMGRLRRAIERWREHWTHDRATIVQDVLARLRGRTEAEPAPTSPAPYTGSGVPASQLGPPPRRPRRPTKRPTDPEPDQGR